LACSALKERYRQKLMDGNPEVQLIYLKGTYDLIWSRMEQRTEHYMKPPLLTSQFDTLEEPADALIVDISMPIDDIVQTILKAIE
jgi:gluconokinase